ncbi:MAG: hypothetical protein JZU64_09155 [Rhodoferax sp.]|nr:hypothetical protein [Rhodoferax sp.]
MMVEQCRKQNKNGKLNERPFTFFNDALFRGFSAQGFPATGALDQIWTKTPTLCHC